MLRLGLEEIAWGQILFGWKTPENIAAVNAQNQTTLHNLDLPELPRPQSFPGFGRAFGVGAVAAFNSKDAHNDP